MTEAVVDDIVTVLPPLLNALEALGYFARHLHPPAFATVMNAIGAPDDALQSAYAAIGAWPEQFAGLRERLDGACNETLAAFAGIRDVERGNGPGDNLSRHHQPVTAAVLGGVECAVGGSDQRA